MRKLMIQSKPVTQILSLGGMILALTSCRAGGDAVNPIGKAKDANGPGTLSLSYAALENGAPVLGGPLSMGSGSSTFPINNVADPTLPQQAATKNYCDNNLAGYPVAVSSLLDGQLVKWNLAQSRWENFTPAFELTMPGGGAVPALDLQGNPINNVADPVAGTDAANKDYVDLMLPLAGGTMTGDISMSGTRQVTNLAVPTAGHHAATKDYVDAAGGGKTPRTVVFGPAGATTTNDNFTPPTGITEVFVTVVGGGGGGGCFDPLNGDSTAGGAGESSSFGALTAAGGAAGNGVRPGAGSIPGENGGYGARSNAGGRLMLSFQGTQVVSQGGSGSQGQGSGGAIGNGGGGGAGYYQSRSVTVTPGTPVAVTVGAGGSAPADCLNASTGSTGVSGSPGVVIVQWYE